MKKQTTIYLSDNDMKKLAKIKELTECNSNTEVIKNLIKEEFDRISKYLSLTE